MPLYTEESLQQLRDKIDLVEITSSFLPLKKRGAYYKALCPFHEEKTPSFTIQKKDSHYYCFGCGAQGDAIAFLMSYRQMSFIESVEYLAAHFGVVLQIKETNRKENEHKKNLQTALATAKQFFHFYLLYSEEGRSALFYLLERGISVPFIQYFQIGLAPKECGTFMQAMRALRISQKQLELVGLLHNQKELFYGRIIFPLLNAIGNEVGFSGRRWQERDRSPKYINTPETILFKKSQMLFGLYYCRKRIIREKRVILVEGQVDALRLIFSGLDIALAVQGTAFSEWQAKEIIKLGVEKIFIAFDMDSAGEKASIHVGEFFQREGIEVNILLFEQGMDPDLVVEKEGIDKFINYMEKSIDYLSFLVELAKKQYDINIPSQKDIAAEEIASRIEKWNHPVMVYESLKKVANLFKMPEETLCRAKPEIQKIKIIPPQINSDQIDETDLLRWLYIKSNDPELVETIQMNLTPESFVIPICRKFFVFFFNQKIPLQTCDILALSIQMNDEEMQNFFNELMLKTTPLHKAKEGVHAAIEKILVRNWMIEKQKIKYKIDSNPPGNKLSILTQQFASLIKNRPRVKLK
ncbi:MAG: DNA primase [Chlamydiales bacterium]